MGPATLDAVISHMTLTRIACRSPSTAWKHASFPISMPWNEFAPIRNGPFLSESIPSSHACPH